MKQKKAIDKETYIVLFVVVGGFAALGIGTALVALLYPVLCIEPALNGYLYRPINPLFRVVMAAGGLCMMIPGVMTDIIGLALLALVWAFQRMGRGAAAAA